MADGEWELEAVEEERDEVVVGEGVFNEEISETAGLVWGEGEGGADRVFRVLKRRGCLSSSSPSLSLSSLWLWRIISSSSLSLSLSSCLLS